MSDAVVVAKISSDSENIRLAVSESSEMADPVFSEVAASDNQIVRLHISDLDPGTQYYYCLEINDDLKDNVVGSFRTKPAGENVSFTCAFGSCAQSGSNHENWTTIRQMDPDFFIHMGDMHYENINSDNPALFRAAYDEVLAQSRQANLYRNVPLVYMWDDHDYGPDDSNKDAPGRDSACQVYRERVPHLPLVETDPTDAIYHSFKIGRVVFIVTDVRSMASPKGDTDNSSKTKLGDVQKQWFKDLLVDEENEDCFFVWVCTSVFNGAPSSGADHWGGYTTERAEIANYIKDNDLAGRIILISGDMHAMAIDYGSNSDYATGGGAPIPSFYAAPLDRDEFQFGGGSYNVGPTTGNARRFGFMTVTDEGGESISIEWVGYDSTGAEVMSHSFEMPPSVEIDPAEDPEHDPYWENVVFLSHFTGEDEDTTAVDVSPYEKTITMASGAKIDDGVLLFGTPSAIRDASDDTISVPHDSNWWGVNESFCIEGWFYWADAPASGERMIMGKYQSSSNSRGLGFYYTNGQLRVYRQLDANTGVEIISTSWTLTTDVWHHLAVSRDVSTGDWRLFVNGQMLSKVNYTADITQPSVAFSIGAQPNDNHPQAFRFREIRVTKGVPRYANDGGFEVPVAPFAEEGEE